MMGGKHTLNSVFPGRVILVIVAVIASSAGFTLGYFVGQNAVVSPVPLLPKPAASDMPSAASAQNPDADTKADTPQPVGPAEDRLSAENKRAAAMPVSQELPRQTAEAGRKDDKTETGLQTDQGTDGGPELSVSSKKKTSFTVQAASYRRQKDADALKQSLETKGYKVYIIKEANPAGTVSFKVRVGEYQQKKEALVAVLRLKKTEGLNGAFATIKK